MGEVFLDQVFITTGEVAFPFLIKDSIVKGIIYTLVLEGWTGICEIIRRVAPSGSLDLDCGLLVNFFSPRGRRLCTGQL